VRPHILGMVLALMADVVLVAWLRLSRRQSNVAWHQLRSLLCSREGMALAPAAGLQWHGGRRRSSTARKRMALPVLRVIPGADIMIDCPTVYGSGRFSSSVSRNLLIGEAWRQRRGAVVRAVLRAGLRRRVVVAIVGLWERVQHRARREEPRAHGGRHAVPRLLVAVASKPAAWGRARGSPAHA